MEARDLRPRTGCLPVPQVDTGPVQEVADRMGVARTQCSAVARPARGAEEREGRDAVIFSHPLNLPSSTFPLSFIIHPHTEEAAAAPAKAEMWASFYADSVTLTNGDTLVFDNASKELDTSLGKTDLDKAFAPGRFPADTQGDGVITGTNGDGKVVSTALRFIDPVFADGKLTVKVAPLAKDATPLLADGFVTKALASPEYTAMSDELKTTTLTKVDVVVDSKAPPKKAEETAAAEPAKADAAAMPAEATAGRKLLYDGNVATGAVVGSAVCGGSWACAAVGGTTAYINQVSGDHERRRSLGGWGRIPVLSQ
jgi:hypothetical protein